MNYQINGNNKQSGYDNTLFGGVGVAGASGSEANGNNGGLNSILSGNSVGDLLACKLVKGGKEPVLDLNGIEIKTKAAKELDNAKPGDTIFLKIQEASNKQVSLKIVGTRPQEIPSMLDAATSAQVMQTTEQMSEMIKDNIGGALDEKQMKENQKEILRSLTTEEISKLRMMQIDVTNAKLSDLMGMVITIRSGEHQEEVNDRIGDVVKETIGKLRESVMAGHEESAASMVDRTDDLLSTVTEEINQYPGGARLNSEGYIVSAASAHAGKSVAGSSASNVARKGMSAMAKAAGGQSAGVQGASDKTNEIIKNGDKPVVTEEQMIYMVKNHMDLTIENLDIAKNSVNEESPAKELPFNNQVWNDIYPQVTGIIEAAGLSVSEQSLNGAKFMLGHELPINVDSLRFYMSVNYVNQRGIQVSQVEANIQEQMSVGNPPEQARISGRTLHEKAVQLMEKVQAITPQSVDKVVAQGKPLSISYLYNVSMRSVDLARMRTPVNTGVEGASLSLSGMTQEGLQPEGAIPLSTNPNAVAARRQMEEIRLSMTMEAATRLMKVDINIDAKPLSQVVDALRQQENSLYENMVSSHDLHEIPDDVDLLKESLRQTEGLKTLPEYTLGEMVKRPTITVGALYETGTRIKAVLANNAYETMMTKPRKDMGDSITEAFQNVDAILEDMNMDRNEANQRAIRILAYNEMELNRANIASVKSADAKVQQMFETLTPQIVLNLIREGKNPLNMTIDGLNEEIMQQREIRGVTDEQRFSEFLYQMDRQNAITEDERKSFIGIYRLLDKIEKSHGKDIGAVVRNGQEVTLNNLFAADKSREVQGMNVAVDDNFGERVSVETKGESILSQVETAYNQTLASSIMRHIRPETLKSLENMDYRNMTFEELNAIMKAGDNGVGQSELVDQISQNLQQALAYEEEVATMLEAHEMPSTVTNMIAAHQVMYGEDGIYGMIRNIKNNLPKEKRDKITQQEANILDNLESKDDVVYGLENIRASLSEAVHAKEEDGTITAMDIQSLKYLNAGMPIAMRAVAEDVFQIPLVVEDEVSIMKVSILRDGSNAGEVSASMDTARYGKLEAFIRVTGDQLEGYIVTEEESGQRALESNELTLRSVFAKAGISLKDVRLDGTRPMQYSGNEEREEVATSKLYRVAKQLLTAIKLMGVAADK